MVFYYISLNVESHRFSSSIKGIEFSWRSNLGAPLTHELLWFHGDLISRMGKLKISLNFTVCGKEKNFSEEEIGL